MTTTKSELYCGKDFRMNMENDDMVITSQSDIQPINYYANLQQAIINRLRTQQGSLTLHPDYGSQLNKLLGGVGNSLLLAEAKQYTREALLQEPRIDKILSIKAKFKEGTNNQIVTISISVKPIASDADVSLDIVWNYFLS